MKELKRLFVIMMPALPLMALAVWLSIFTVASNVGLLAVSAHLIGSAALHPPLAALAVAITGVRFFGISRAVCRYGERYMSHKATFQILYALRVWLYSRLEPLAPGVLSRYRSGDLLARIVTDVDTLQFFYLRVIAPPVVAFVTLCGMWLFLGGYSMASGWLLTLAFAVGGLFVPYLVQRLGRANSDELLLARAELKASLVDTIHGMAELSAAHQGSHQADKLADIADKLRQTQAKAANLAAIAEASSSFVMNASGWGALIIAIPLAAAGTIEKVYLGVLVLAIQACFEALQPLPLAGYMLAESLAAAKRLFAIADAPQTVIDTGDQSLVPEEWDVIFRNVSFAYEPGQQAVLQDISFTIPTGRRVAIVGASGAGKTTLASLLLRFSEYTGGSICLGGHDLRSYHPEQLRRYLAVVSQDTHIFNTSIGDNIRLAFPDATDGELTAAAGHVMLADWIDSLPDGYDTLAGLNGKSMSGGQRQRLAIARALLKNAPVLILDEPTASLDAITEQEIMASIKRLMHGRTTLLITHRLTGLEDMDAILVLDNGRIAEQGTAQELLEQQGLFYRLWKLQSDVI